MPCCPQGGARPPLLPSPPAALLKSKQPRGGCTASRAVRHLAPTPPEGMQCWGERGCTPQNGGPQPGLGVGHDRGPGGSHMLGDPQGHRRGPQAWSTARRQLPLTVSSHTGWELVAVKRGLG